MKLPISVLVLTQNEEANIAVALASVSNCFDQVVVTDSFSVDKTYEICKTFAGVEIYQHKFENWADQRNWMLNNCEIRNDVIFFLDADEYITPDFVDELLKIITSGVRFSSISLSPSYIFLNRRLRYAYGHPKVRRIFKKSGLKYYCDGARDHAIAIGSVLEMKEPFIHHDRKPISTWIAKHNVNAGREAAFYCSGTGGHNSSSIPSDLRIRAWIRKNIWNRLPLLVRPFLYFIYRYIIKLGFLDGKAGLIYCYLHAFWYQSLIDIMIIEKNIERK